MTFAIENVSEETKDLLLWSQVQAGHISQEIFQSNYELTQSNPAFTTMLKGMRDNPATTFMYNAMMAAGPEAILATVGMLVDAQVIDKKQVRDAAKIKKAPKSQKAWHKQIAEELFALGHSAIAAAYQERVEAFRTKFPNETIPADLEGFLRATGKASISTTVDNYEHPQSKKSCALALVLRVDVNCAARNGTKEAASEDAPSNGV